MKLRAPTPNKKDACCVCGKLLPTPADVEKPAAGELRVLQARDSKAPDQWICAPCEEKLG